MTIQRSVSYKIQEFVERHHFKGGKRLAYLFSKALLPIKGASQEIKTREGNRMIVDPTTDKGIEYTLYYTGSYEAGLVEIMKHFLKPGDTFFEVGANIAPFSILASKLIGDNGKAVAIEPDPNIVKIIKKNIKANKAKNIEVVNQGVGSKRSKMKLYLKPGINRGASSLIKEDGDKAVNVQVDTLDNIIKNSKVKKVSMMIIDVEGWELEAMKGSTWLFKRKNLPLLSVEINSRYYPKELYNTLKKIKGYTIFKLKDGKEYISKLTKVRSFRDVKMDDNLFCLTKEQIKQLSDIIL